MGADARKPKAGAALSHAPEPGGHADPGRPYFSLCLPAFNEEANLGPCIDEALAVLPQLVPSLEIVVVDDGSRDRTPTIAREYAQRDERIRVISHPRNLGYGAAVATAFRESRGEVAMLMDSDGQFRTAHVAPFLEQVKCADVVVGFRRPRADGAVRRLNAFAWAWLVRLCLGVKLRDLDCAYKLFRRRVLEQLALTAGGACISAEIMMQCRQKGFRVVELPVPHYPRREGQATGANWSVVARAFAELPLIIGHRLRNHA